MKAQTASDLIEAVAQNLLLDAKCAEAAAFECYRKGARRENLMLRTAAEKIRVIIDELRAN